MRSQTTLAADIAYLLMTVAMTLGCATSAGLDADGVRALARPAAGRGAGFRLGGGDPNQTARFAIEKRTPATPEREGALRFWSVPAYRLDYSSGGQGKTVRLHIYSGDHPQQFTWRTQRGYLSTPADLRDVELTVYLRARGIMDPRRAAISLKVRGGRHTEDDGDLASCVMMTFQAATTGAPARFGKELTHPDYDYVALPPRRPFALEDGRWVGLKLVSAGLIHRLYVDPDPWTAAGHPRNAWELFSEYEDAPGKRTGRHYDTAVDWGGWVTTVRADGIERLEFAIVSAREIAAE